MKFCQYVFLCHYDLSTWVYIVVAIFRSCLGKHEVCFLTFPFRCFGVLKINELSNFWIIQLVFSQSPPNCPCQVCFLWLVINFLKVSVSFSFCIIYLTCLNFSHPDQLSCLFFCKAIFMCSTLWLSASLWKPLLSTEISCCHWCGW